jgi:hypothetical protein
MDTLFLPTGRVAMPTGHAAGRTLPPHLQEQLPRRLRNIALLLGRSSSPSWSAERAEAWWSEHIPVQNSALIF